MRFSNRSLGWMFAAGMFSLLVMAMLVRRFGDYPPLMATPPASTAR